ncbi:MAG: hypothetical protein ACMUHX_09810 [bacterium]
MYKVMLTLDEQGKVIDVEPRDHNGNILRPVKKNLGVDWTSNGTIDNVTSLTILSKPGHSPCCVINGGTVWCWC